MNGLPKSGNAASAPEFSRPLDVSTLPPRGHDEETKANPEECAALARRLGVTGISGLTAHLQVRPIAGGAVQVQGTFAADIAQSCVVTLEPIETHVAGPLTATFVAATQDVDEEEDVDPVADDIDVMQDHTIDLGDIVVQHLALAIDPYPRKPGATFSPALQGASSPTSSVVSPFAALAKLKSDSKSK